MAGGVINPNMVANAYGSTQKIGGASDLVKDVIGKADSSAEGGVSFSDLLKSNVKDSIDTIKAGEKMSSQAVTGKAELTDVVQAITSAELTLQTVVAVRDRMISAYQEIMRMPI